MAYLLRRLWPILLRMPAQSAGVEFAQESRTMRIAVISDIRGNLAAFNAVLAAIEAEERIERIVCAGDSVGLGPRPNEVLEGLRKNDIDAVLGNYDDAAAWQRSGSGVDFPPG